MTSLTQHIARCYLSKQWKTCQKAKLRLLSIMIYRLRNYRLTSKKYSESLTCDYEDLDSWLLRKKQPHIDEKELKRIERTRGMLRDRSNQLILEGMLES